MVAGDDAEELPEEVQCSWSSVSVKTSNPNFLRDLDGKQEQKRIGRGWISNIFDPFLQA